MARLGVSQTLNFQLEWPKLCPMSWAYKIINKQSGFFVPIRYKLTECKYRCTVNGVDHGVEIQDYSDFKALVISKAGINLYRIVDDNCGETRTDGEPRIEIRICLNNEKLVWKTCTQGGLTTEQVRYRNPVVKGDWDSHLGKAVLYYGIRNTTIRRRDIETFIKICRTYKI